MKVLVLAAVVTVTAASLTACNEPIPAYQDIHHPLQVSMTDYYTQDSLRVNKITPERTGAGQLKVTVELFNRRDWEMTVDYKPRFMDKNGMQVDNDIGWQLVRIPQRGYQSFSFTSMSAAAEDFQVQLRRAQ
jgi:predicted small secreted protein